MKVRLSERSEFILVAAWCAVVAFLAYHNTLSSFFVFDDFGIIYNVAHDKPWPFEQFLRPVTALIWRLSYLVSEVNVVGYRFTNTALHAANGFLIYRLASRLRMRAPSGRDLGRAPAVSAGLLFLVLPGHSEAVSWLAARVDLIATFFFLASLLLFTDYHCKRCKQLLVFSIASFLSACCPRNPSLFCRS